MVYYRGKTNFFEKRVGEYANFEGANLTDAELSVTTLTDVNFTRATFEKSKMQQNDFDKIWDKLSQEQIDGIDII